MREELAELLRCPRCAPDDRGLVLHVREQDAGEVLTALLTCAHCGSAYQVREGVPHLLAGGNDTVVGESRAYRNSRPGLLAEWGSDRAAKLAIARMEHTSEEFRRSSDMNLTALWDALAPRRNEWALELGAGSCLHSVELAGRGCRSVAVDISVDLKLELGGLLARSRGVTIDRVVGDMGNLPFRSGAMDVVYSTASLHHSSDLVTTLGEAGRVLCPSGRFGAASEPMHGPLSWWSLGTCARAMEELPGSHEASYTLFQWTSALRKAGLKASFLWPPYYDHLLEAGAGGTKFGPLGRIMTSFWRSDAVRRVVKGPLLPWLQMTVGINALFVARKRGV